MQGSVDDVTTGVVGLGGGTASRVITVRPALLSATSAPRTTCLQLSYNYTPGFPSRVSWRIQRTPPLDRRRRRPQARSWGPPGLCHDVKTTTRIGVGRPLLQGLLTCGQLETTASTSMSARSSM